jgi:hypothetical protein
MVCAEIDGDQVERLRALLAAMNTAPGVVDPQNDLVPFSSFDRLHVARFVIIEAQTTDDIKAYGVDPHPWPPTLIFLGDCDGPYQHLLAEMAERAGPGLRKIFSHCKGFHPGNDILLIWMQEHNKKPAANYINWIGRTVTQVHEEATLHAALRTSLETLLRENADMTPSQIHQSLREFVRAEQTQGRLILSDEPKTPVSWRLANTAHKIGVPLILILLTPLILLLLPFLAVKLRSLEKSDPEIAPRPDRTAVVHLAEAEDRLVTNQFSAFGDVKPGSFRRYAVIVFLFGLDYAARHVYNRGYLTRVQTIHFARWVLLDDKQRLFFASNYDGDLESYMDDFINKVGWGLNLVFSNGVGWPKTRWLLKDGAEREQKFKYFLRRHQHYTDVWYKAYPEINAVDLARNARVRRGLINPGFRNNDELRKWLGDI